MIAGNIFEQLGDGYRPQNETPFARAVGDAVYGMGAARRINRGR